MRDVLVLWDVDGTLVNVEGLGAAAFTGAFRQLYGRDPGPFPSLGGRTDRWIVTDMYHRNEVPDTDLEPFREAAEALFAGTAHELTVRGRVLPGAAQALAALRAESAVQSLLTGNIRSFAELKLRWFGLAEHVDFDIGGYGWSHPVRAELVTLARAAAQARHGDAFEGRRTVLIGDTPRDVEAALATGASVVAVASGGYPESSLHDAGAHVVLPSLDPDVSGVDIVSAVRAAVGFGASAPGASALGRPA